MREEHDPLAQRSANVGAWSYRACKTYVVADELVEVDGAVGGLGLEVGGSVAQAKGSRTGFACHGDYARCVECSGV